MTVKCLGFLWSKLAGKNNPVAVIGVILTWLSREDILKRNPAIELHCGKCRLHIFGAYGCIGFHVSYISIY